MGKIAKIFYENTIAPEAEQNSNLIRVFEAPNKEVTIHIRNLKIVLHTPEEITEWKRGFAEAEKKLNEISSN